MRSFQRAFVIRSAALCAVLFGLSACKSSTNEPASTPAQTQQSPAKQSEPLYAVIETNQGTMVAQLFPNDAPKTVQNFVGLAKGEKEWTDPKTGEKTRRPLYDGTIFHRVIPDFMIQGGDPLGTGTGGPGYRFEDEFQSGRKFDKPCLLAMANSGPNTNGSQFFITQKPTPWLNNRHTIFGELVKGCDVVDKIVAQPRGARDRPVTDVVIQHITITDKMP